MQQPFEATNNTDADGNPAGGVVNATGIHIDWQNGPLVGPDGERKEPTGAFVETVIAAARARILYYQDSRFACSENEEAIEALDKALAALDRRTKAREAQGVEGTHKEHRS